MPPKNKTETTPVDPDVTAPVDDMTDSDEMATVLETLADLSERLERVERAQTEAPGQARAEARMDIRQAAAASTDPVFRAQVGRGDRRRESEGERQDKITQENARRHLHEPAGDGVVTAPITSGVPARTDEPGEGGMEDAASPRFDERGEHGETVASTERE